MIIYTNDRQKIETRNGERPEWSEPHKRFYVAGYRWIKSRQKFSGNCLLHNFTGWSEDEQVSWNQ